MIFAVLPSKKSLANYLLKGHLLILKSLSNRKFASKCSNISHRGVQCGVWCESAVMRLLRGDGVELSVDAADDGLWSG